MGAIIRSLVSTLAMQRDIYCGFQQYTPMLTNDKIIFLKPLKKQHYQLAFIAVMLSTLVYGLISLGFSFTDSFHSSIRVKTRIEMYYQIWRFHYSSNPNTKVLAAIRLYKLEAFMADRHLYTPKRILSMATTTFEPISDHIDEKPTIPQRTQYFLDKSGYSAPHGHYASHIFLIPSSTFSMLNAAKGDVATVEPFTHSILINNDYFSSPISQYAVIIHEDFHLETYARYFSFELSEPDAYKKEYEALDNLQNSVSDLNAEEKNKIDYLKLHLP